MTRDAMEQYAEAVRPPTGCYALNACSGYAVRTSTCAS